MVTPDELPELVWPAAVVLLGIIVAIAALFVLAFRREPGSIVPVVSAWVESQAMIRLIGIIIIVPAICALGILDKISGGEAITAISAIAGYVLGSTGHRNGSIPPRPPAPSP